MDYSHYTILLKILWIHNIVDGESRDNSFDLMTFRDYSTFEVEDDLGNLKVLECNERYYVPSEITWLLKSLNFTKIEIFSCEIGNFSRDIELRLMTMKCW